MQTTNHLTTQSKSSVTIKLILAGLCGTTFILLILNGAAFETALNEYPFHDPDDIMRMVQVVDWVHGASWFDLTQPRLNPPHGVAMHWSRLPDIPLAATYMLASYVLPQEQAIIITAILTPPILGIAFFLAFLWASKPLIARAELIVIPGIICFILLNSVVGQAFVAGRVDHHGWQLLLAIVSLGGILRIRHADKKAVIAGALSLSLGLWIGAEALVPLGLSCIALTLVWIRTGKDIAKDVRLFGLTLALSTILTLTIAIAPTKWSAAACDAFSIVSVALAFAVALFFYLVTYIDSKTSTLHQRGRFIVSILVGSTLIIAVLWLFPSCLNGPYSTLSPEWKAIFADIPEAKSFAALLSESPPKAAFFLALPLFALILAICMLIVTKIPEERETWMILAVFIAGGVLVTLWQIRGGVLTNAYAGLACTRLATQSAARFIYGKRSYRNLLLGAWPVALTGLLPIIALYTVLLATYDETNHVNSRPGNCDWVSAARKINLQDRDNSHRQLIATLSRQASIFLLLTPDQVLGTYFHRDQEGIVDTLDIFKGDIRTAKSIILRRGVTMLFLCKSTKPSQYESQKSTFSSLEEQLQHNQIPDWLEKTYSEGDLIGFTVKRP